MKPLVIVALAVASIAGSSPALAGLRGGFYFSSGFHTPRVATPRCYVPRVCYYQPSYYWVGPATIRYSSGPTYSVAAPLVFSTTSTVNVASPREVRAPLLDQPIEVTPVAFRWRR